MEALTGPTRPGDIVCAPRLRVFVLYPELRKKTRMEVMPLWSESHDFLLKWISVLCFCSPYC